VKRRFVVKKEFNKTKERIRIHDKSNRNPIEHIKKRKEIEIEIKIKKQPSSKSVSTMASFVIYLELF
jgi:hypothetical protein